MIETLAHEINRNLYALMTRYLGVILLVQSVGLPYINVLIKEHKLNRYRKNHEALSFFLLHLTGAIYYADFKSLRNIPKKLRKNPNFVEWLRFKWLPCHDACGEELRRFIPLLVDFNANLIAKAKELGAIKKKSKVLFDDIKITLKAKRYEETHVILNTKNKQYEPMITLHLAGISGSKLIGIGIVESACIGGTKVYPSLKDAMDKLIEDYEQAYDMGYTDLSRYIDHMENDEKFVTPLKSSINFTLLAQTKFRGRKDGILADMVVALDSIDKYTFRLIKKKKKSKKGYFYLLTNDFKKSPKEIVEWYDERWDIEIIAKDTTVEMALKQPYGYRFETVVASILFKIVAYNMLMLFKFITNRQDWSIRELIDYVQQPFDHLNYLAEDIWRKIIELCDQLDKNRSLSAPKLTTLTNLVETKFIHQC